MTEYYKYGINRKALPWQLQITRTGYRRPDHTGFQSMRAILTIGWSKREKKLIFLWKGTK